MALEIWKTIAGYANLYEVSSFGRVRSIDRIIRKHLYKGKILKEISNKGYKLAHLSKNSKGKLFLVHRLVALAFIPNPENLLEVNHKDLNKSHNHVSNLEWVSRHTNMKHAIDNGKLSHIYGENNKKSKLTWEQVNNIRKDYLENNITHKELSFKYKIAKSGIAKIIQNKHWHDPDYQLIINTGRVSDRTKQSCDGENNSQSKLCENEVLEIRNLYKHGCYTFQNLADQFQVSRSCIRFIINRKLWNHI